MFLKAYSRPHTNRVFRHIYLRIRNRGGHTLATKLNTGDTKYQVR